MIKRWILSTFISKQKLQGVYVSGAAANPGGTSLPPRISEEKHSQTQTIFAVKDLRRVLPPQIGIRRWILFSVGVRADVSAHHVSVSFLLVEPRRRRPPFLPHCLACPALFKPAQPFSNLSDRSDTSGVCKDRQKGAVYKQHHTGGQPLSPRGSRDKQVIDFLNYPGVRHFP